MSDVFTKTKRSEVMSRIRSRGNKDTEIALAKVFRKNQITGWRRHLKIRIPSRLVVLRSREREKVAGGRMRVVGEKQNARGGKRNGVRGATRPIFFTVRPDFVFPKLKLAVFVDGCFWHGCPKHATRPKNNRSFWDKKLASNKVRDLLVTKTLKRANWRVIRIWECNLTRFKVERVAG